MIGRIALAIVSTVFMAGVGSASAQDRSGAAVVLALAAAEVPAAAPELAGPQLPRPIAEAAENERLRRTLAAERRPGALTALYAGLAGLNALDAYSTVRALDRGARELNPVVSPAAGNMGAVLALKAAATAGSIYFAERLWKKNRAAAIVTMVAVNAATAAVVARNVRNAR